MDNVSITFTMTASGAGSSGDNNSTDRTREAAALKDRLPLSSQLCNLCLAIEPKPPIFEFDIADYCIGDSSTDLGEILYKDACIVLSRQDFRSFEPDSKLISPTIISAWARTLNYKWVQRGTSRACMELVNMDVASFNNEAVIASWKKWIKASNVDFFKTQLVLIPVRKDEHTFLLGVNFRQRKLHYLDTEDQTKMDKITEGIFCLYCTLLMQMGDFRAMELNAFEYDVSKPHWSVISQKDGGMFLMQAMELYDGSMYMPDLIADEQCLYLGRRITYCTRIAFSTLNKLNAAVLDGIAQQLKLKLDGKAGK